MSRQRTRLSEQTKSLCKELFTMADPGEVQASPNIPLAHHAEQQAKKQKLGAEDLPVALSEKAAAAIEKHINEGMEVDVPQLSEQLQWAHCRAVTGICWHFDGRQYTLYTSFGSGSTNVPAELRVMVVLEGMPPSSAILRKKQLQELLKAKEMDAVEIHVGGTGTFARLVLSEPEHRDLLYYRVINLNPAWDKCIVEAHKKPLVATGGRLGQTRQLQQPQAWQICSMHASHRNCTDARPHRSHMQQYDWQQWREDAREMNDWQWTQVQRATTRILAAKRPWQKEELAVQNKALHCSDAAARPDEMHDADNHTSPPCPCLPGLWEFHTIVIICPRWASDKVGLSGRLLDMHKIIQALDETEQQALEPAHYELPDENGEAVLWVTLRASGADYWDKKGKIQAADMTLIVKAYDSSSSLTLRTGTREQQERNPPDYGIILRASAGTSRLEVQVAAQDLCARLGALYERTCLVRYMKTKHQEWLYRLYMPSFDAQMAALALSKRSTEHLKESGKDLKLGGSFAFLEAAAGSKVGRSTHKDPDQVKHCKEAYKRSIKYADLPELPATLKVKQQWGYGNGTCPGVGGTRREVCKSMHGGHLRMADGAATSGGGRKCRRHHMHCLTKQCMTMSRYSIDNISCIASYAFESAAIAYTVLRGDFGEDSVRGAHVCYQPACRHSVSWPHQEQPQLYATAIPNMRERAMLTGTCECCWPGRGGAAQHRQHRGGERGGQDRGQGLMAMQSGAAAYESGNNMCCMTISDQCLESPLHARASLRQTMNGDNSATRGMHARISSYVPASPRRHAPMTRRASSLVAATAAMALMYLEFMFRTYMTNLMLQLRHASREAYTCLEQRLTQLKHGSWLAYRRTRRRLIQAYKACKTRARRIRRHQHLQDCRRARRKRRRKASQQCRNRAAPTGRLRTILHDMPHHEKRAACRKAARSKGTGAGPTGSVVNACGQCNGIRTRSHLST
jgi:hypothetical protein